MRFINDISTGASWGEETWLSARRAGGNGAAWTMLKPRHTALTHERQNSTAPTLIAFLITETYSVRGQSLQI